jgi:hypothetical protein
MTVFNRLKSGVLVAAAITIPVLANGCSAANDLQNAACCTDFKVGADMTGVDFKVDASIKGQFTSLAQASGDLSAVAAASLTDVTAACKAIATDLGAKADDPSTTGKGGADLATQWCTLAVAQIKANAGFTAATSGGAKLQLQISPPECHVEASFQASCEGSCKADVSCTEPDLTARCDPGQLSGQCSASCTGTCEGSVNAAASCEGSCDASCEGSCEAQGGVAVDCTGTCSGNCNGSCEGAAGTTQTTAHCDGTCKGKCDAKCEVAANAPTVKCAGKCTGKCTGGCKFAADAKIKCDASCKGGCSVAVTAPKCDVDLKPPTCKGDASCQANCKASGQARASCTPPSVKLAASASVTFNADAQASFDILVNTLEVNLPKLVLVFKARGDAFVTDLKAVADAGVSLSADPGKLSGKATACIVPIAAAASTALTNMQASLSASGSVVTTITSAAE